jgi:hypothetical protein
MRAFGLSQFTYAPGAHYIATSPVSYMRPKMLSQ